MSHGQIGNKRELNLLQLALLSKTVINLTQY